MFEQVIMLLKQVAEDPSVPRNIKEKVKESMAVLQNEQEEPKVRISTAIANLDEVSNDTNIPMYTRIQVWNIVTALETLQGGEKKA